MLSTSARKRPFRICITGAECTGKTALARALAEDLGVPLVEEAVRDYFAAKIENGDPNIFVSDVLRAVDLQSQAEDSAPIDVPLLVLDTDVFTIDVWHERIIGRRIAELDELVEFRQASDKRIDLYLLAAPDIPFIFDSLRASEAFRTEMHEVFRRRLAGSGRRFIEVEGTLEERVAQGKAALSLALVSEPRESR